MYTNPNWTAEQALEHTRQLNFCSTVTQIAPLAHDTVCHTIAMSRREGSRAPDGTYYPSTKIFTSELVVHILPESSLAFNGTAIRETPAICGAGVHLLFINCAVVDCAYWSLELTPFVTTRQEGFVLYHLFDRNESQMWRFTFQSISVEASSTFKRDFRNTRRLIAVWSGTSRGLGMKDLKSGVPAAEAEFPSVVSLKYETETLTSYCTGTIIGTHATPWLLTAKHCIDAKPFSEAKLIVVGCGQRNVLHSTAHAFTLDLFQTDIYFYRPLMMEFSSEAIATNLDTDGPDVVTKDVAVISLNGIELPSCQDVSPVAWEYPEEDSTITLVGYGSTLVENDPTRADTYGILHKLTLNFDTDAVTDGNSWCRGLNGSCGSSQIYAGSSEYLMSVGMGVRSGDSGGPMFTDTGEVLGIASHLKDASTAHILIPDAERGIIGWLQSFLPKPPSPPPNAELSNLGMITIAPINATCAALGARDVTYAECELVANLNGKTLDVYDSNEWESGCFYHKDYVEWYGTKQYPFTCVGFDTPERPGDGCLCSSMPAPPLSPSPLLPPSTPPSPFTPPPPPPAAPCIDRVCTTNDDCCATQYVEKRPTLHSLVKFRSKTAVSLARSAIRRGQTKRSKSV